MIFKSSIKKALVVVVFIILTYALSIQASAQTSNKGTDFWIGFMDHGDGTRADMFFYITSDSNTSGTVSVPGQSWSTSFSVTAGSMTLVAIPNSVAYVACSDCKQSKGIHVASSKPVVVYSHIYYQYRSDATLCLPTPTTGKEYYIMSIDQKHRSRSGRSQFMIIASQDDTKVRITPSTDLKGSSGTKNSGTPYEINLDKGEVYQAQANGGNETDDVTGTHIEVIDTGSASNCRKVAVFSGSSNCFIGTSCSYTTGSLASYDNLYQQLYPTSSWGTKFVTIPFKGRTYDEIRIMASQDGTNVVVFNETGNPDNFYLDAGEYRDYHTVSETKYMFASKPISVAQFQVSQKCGGTGDPSMTILNPIEQTLKNITVYSSQYEDIDDHYINVIIPTNATGSFRIDGNTASFTKVKKKTSLSYAQITVTKGNHTLAASEGFLAIAYGFGRYESYGYAAGANVKDLTAQIDFANSAEATNDINSICIGEDAEFEGYAEYAVSKWVWDFGDGTQGTSSSVKHTYKDTGYYVVTLYTHKVSFDGCSTYDSTLLDIRVNDVPKADFDFTALCEKNTVIYTDKSTVPAYETILSRQWQFHDKSVKYSTNASKYYDTSGVFSVSLITTTERQCKDTMTRNLTISPNPVAGISINDVCFKDSARFNNTSTVRLGKIASNKWYFGDGDSSTAFHPAHFYKDSGVYYISLTTTTDSGCFASVKDTIKKYPRFDLGFSHLDTCVGFDLNFTNTTTSDGGILHDWAWLFHDGTEKNTYGSTFNYTTAGTYDVQLSVVQDTFCYDTIIKQVVVDPDVTADFTFSGGCLSDTVRFTATSSVPSGSVAVNSWTLGDGFTATGDSAKVKYTSKGTKSVTLISSSGAGCSDTVSKNVLIKNPRILDMSNPLICDGQAAKVYGIYNLDNDTITNWDWASDGITNTLDTFVITNPVVGKFEVELIIRTKNNCTAVFYDSVTVYPNPIADFTVSPICEGTNFVIVNNSSIGSPGVISNQRWFKNGTQVSTSANPSIMATPPGTTTLRLLLTSDKNCTHEISKDVEVYANPVANFNFVNTCLGETTAFTDNSTISLGSISTRNWLFSTGNMATGSTASETFATVGSKTAILEVVSNNDCRDTIQKTIVIDPKPSIVISANKYDGCVPFTPTFVNACTIASGTIDTYNWDFGDGATSSGNAPTHTYTSLGFFDIQVIGTSDKGCKDTALTPSQIEVLAAPVADFSYSPQDPSLLFPGVTFTNISSPDAATFKWYISDGTSYSSNDVNHTFLTTGDFDVTLVAEAANGCLDTILQTVKVKADFFIYAPSTFTPNGDNLNDVFKIYGIIPDVKGYSLMIIDRWGGMIFNSTNTAEYWDGTVQGVPVPNGMYAFSARYINIETGHFEVLNGMVSVMR